MASPQKDLPIAQPAEPVAQVDDISAILKQSFKPRSEQAAAEVENAVQTLVTQALQRLHDRQGRRHRHDRGNDRPDRRKAVRADE